MSLVFLAVPNIAVAYSSSFNSSQFSYRPGSDSSSQETTCDYRGGGNLLVLSCLLSKHLFLCDPTGYSCVCSVFPSLHLEHLCQCPCQRVSSTTLIEMKVCYYLIFPYINTFSTYLHYLKDKYLGFNKFQANYTGNFLIYQMILLHNSSQCRKNRTSP